MRIGAREPRTRRRPFFRQPALENAFVVIIKQRKMRKSSRFQPRWTRGTRKQGDYLVSLYTMAVVQALLFVFLLVGAYRSFAAMRDKLEDLGWYLRYGIPLVMVVIAIFVLKLLIDSIKQAVEFHKEPPAGT